MSVRNFVRAFAATALLAFLLHSSGQLGVRAASWGAIVLVGSTWAMIVWERRSFKRLVARKLEQARFLAELEEAQRTDRIAERRRARLHAVPDNHETEES